MRKAGARIRLIGDGDVSAAIATTKPETGIDLLMGIGGAPEGVLAAAALRCIGGAFQGRLAPRNDEEIERAKKMGVADIKKKFRIDELAAGDVMFAATGVTDGDYLRGVHFFTGGATTQSVVMRSKTKTVRVINEGGYRFSRPNANPRDALQQQHSSRMLSSAAELLFDASQLPIERLNLFH